MKQRQTELDILRLLAMLGVVMTHVCVGPVKSLPLDTPEWIVLNCFRAAVTWDVPIFVMISGRFLLDPLKDITIEKIYKKYVKRLMIAFLVWSAVYQIYYACYAAATDTITLTIKGYLTEWLTGAYHLWYLYMLAGLYILIPFLRKFTLEKKLMEYFLVLFVVFQSLVNYGVAVPIFGNIIQTILGKTYFYFALGYTGYFVLGYYLYKYEIPDKFEVPLYIASFILIVFSCVGTSVQSRHDGVLNEWFSKYQMPNIIIESAGLYTLFVKRINKICFSNECQALFCKLAELSFGVYLIHALVIEFIGLTGITAADHPLVMVPVLTLISLVLSLLLTMLIRKIPHLGKVIT